MRIHIFEKESELEGKYFLQTISNWVKINFFCTKKFDEGIFGCNPATYCFFDRTNDVVLWISTKVLL